MSEDMRSRIREGYRETVNGINRTTATLSLTCLSVVILNGIDDSAILGNETVSTPFVGQTRYELFVLIAPAVVTALRLYIDLQISHLARLTKLVRHFRLRTSLQMLASNTLVLWIAGAVVIHVAPPATIVMVGYHASAAHPQWGLGLYGWATALLVWSFIFTFIMYRPSVPTRIFAAALSVFVVVGVVGVANLNQSVNCERRYEGLGERLSPAFLRKIQLSWANLSSGNFEYVNLSCGNLKDAQFKKSDLRFARFWWANLQRATFEDSKIAYAEFHGARLEKTNLSGADGNFSDFIHSQLNDANFSNAKLTDVSFNHSRMEDSKLINAKLKSASFYKTQLGTVDLSGAELIAAEFNEAELYEINFTNANLFKARFEDAEVIRTKFDGADLRCSTFLGATLIMVDFSGVSLENMQGARFPDPDKMEDVSWPKGFDPRAATKSSENC